MYQIMFKPRCLVVLCGVMLAAGVVLCHVPPEVRVNYTRDADAIIGGLLPFHTGPTCHRVLDSYWVEVAETIVYAVDQVNQRADLLENISLGFDIRESCYNEDLTLWSSLFLLSAYGDAGFDVEPNNSPTRGNLIGIVGSANTATGIVAAKATNLYKVPYISFYATSDELSDQDRFPYFLRTVPPDRFQAKALIDIILRFDWKYIGMIYSLDTYGILGTQELLTLSDKNGICVAYSILVRESAAQSEIHDVVSKLRVHRHAKVIVVFGEFSGIYHALQLFHTSYPEERRTILGSDAFGHRLDGYHFADLIAGSIAISLNFQEIPGMKKYMEELSVQNEASPWYIAARETWMKGKNCSVISDCSLPAYGTWMPIYQAVYTFAYALDDLVRQTCPQPRSDCSSFVRHGIQARDMMPYLINVTFDGPGGLFRFDSIGNPEGTYKVTTLIESDSQAGFEWIEIGSWDSRRLDLPLSIQEDAIAWPNGEPPVSLCREDCQPGYIIVPLEEKCCLGCQQCSPNEMVKGNIECIACDPYFWPSEDFTVCKAIQPTTINVTEAVVLILLILSLIGAIFALLSIAGMYYYRQHVLIKSTGREASLVIITGTIIACFTVIVALLVYPTVTSCAVCEIMISMCFTLTYAPTTLKVNRVHRIFEAAKKSTRRPNWTRPKDQILFNVLLIGIQVIIVTASALTNSLGKPELLIPRQFENYVEIYCLFGSGFLASCVYNLLLVLVCCYYALKTRKLPSNYNESKFIAVSVYSTLVLCLSAVPVYATATSVLQKVATLCAAVLLNAYMTLGCVYLPKMYAARFVKDVGLLRCNTSVLVGESSSRVHPVSSVSALSSATG